MKEFQRESIKNTQTKQTRNNQQEKKNIPSAITIKNPKRKSHFRASKVAIQGSQLEKLSCSWILK